MIEKGGNKMKKVLMKAKRAMITSLALIVVVAGIAASKPIQTKAASAASYNCMHTTARVFWHENYWDLFVRYKDFCPKCGLVFGEGKTPGGFLFNSSVYPVVLP